MLGQQVVGVVVKEGLSTFAGIHLHPQAAQDLIRAGAERALAGINRAKPLELEANSEIELEFEHQARADQAVNIPGVTRSGERAVAYRPRNGLEFIHTFRAIMKAATIQMSP